MKKSHCHISIPTVAIRRPVELPSRAETMTGLNLFVVLKSERIIEEPSGTSTAHK